MKIAAINTIVFGTPHNPRLDVLLTDFGITNTKDISYAAFECRYSATIEQAAGNALYTGNALYNRWKTIAGI